MISDPTRSRRSRIPRPAPLPFDAVDVRIGVTQAPRELNVEVPDDERDDVRAKVDAALSGANDVLWVSPHREVRTFFVPPVIDTGGCAGVPNNDPEHTGCDPVPTGVAGPESG